MKKDANENNRRPSYNKAYCFLYIVGMQSVRIMKRLGRRLRRFFRPVTELIKRLVHSMVGSRLQSARKELARMKEGVAIAGQRVNTARQKGVGACLAECAKVTGKSVVRHRRMLLGAVNILAPIAAVIVLVLTIQFWSNQNFGLVLAYDGQEIATIQDEQVFEQATEMVNSRLISNVAGGGDVELLPSYTLAVVDSARFATPSVLCDKLIEQSGDVIEEASGLYMDGELMGVVKEYGALQNILNGILEEAKGGEENVEASFVQNIELVTGLYPTSTIIETERMKGILTQSTVEDAYYTVETGDAPLSIAAKFDMSFDELSSLNQESLDVVRVGEKVKVQAAKPLLTVQLVKEETYQKDIPFKTVTTKTDKEYTDYSKVTQKGQKGRQECVDKVTYVDGVEVSRESVSRKTLKAAQDKKVTVGTKKRSSVIQNEEGSGVSSGSLMWPLPYTRNITSYYEWRWGRMHNGLDIAAGGVYGKPIVAADGGTVRYVKLHNYGYGYHLEIDHGNGTRTLYAHCSKIYVRSGQKVSKGQIIAAVGSTGDSTGAHLHYEVYVNGSRRNPLNFY